MKIPLIIDLKEGDFFCSKNSITLSVTIGIYTKLKFLINKSISYSFGLLGLIIFSFFAYSCGEDKTTGPANLNLSISIQGADENNPYGDGSGIITCTATAENAVRYAYKFDRGDLQESEDGTIAYTFLRKGTHTYSVLVFAYSSNGEYINKTQSVRVFQSDVTTATLVFSDEFDVDGSVDSDKWLFETFPPNNGSWWNSEKQHYTDRLDNANVSNGTLKIVARKEEYTFAGSTKNYTSARLNSKFNFTYGKIDVKAKLPTGVGTWPAIWTLGSNYNTVGWPVCGEIDIMEHWGVNPTIISSAVHTVACSGDCPDVKVGERVLSDYATAFHIYSVEWTVDAIKFYLDNQLLYSYDPLVKTDDNWPFTNDQFILLNVAMGGSWFDIDPDFSESVMEIDYVRVYQ
jgi:beta-glucanase (GH16 family)